MYLNNSNKFIDNVEILEKLLSDSNNKNSIT